MQPTINLLTNLDVLHPDVLLQYDIQPADYKDSLVFRSAIESIRGKFIASSTASREGLVNGIIDSLLQQQWIADYSRSSNVGRYDFTVALERNPDYFAAIEVKGGEGNSINISEVHVKIVELSSGKLQREIRVLHQGEVVDRSVSRPWQS